MKKVTYIEIIGGDWDTTARPALNLIGSNPYIIGETSEWYGHKATVFERRSDGRIFCVYPRGYNRNKLHAEVEEMLA